MKLLLSCDDYCFQYENDYYLRDFGHTLAKRYLMAFDAVRMVLRTKRVNSKEELGKYNIKVNDPRIEIMPVNFFQGPKQYLKQYFKIKKSIKNCTEGCSAAVLRLPSTTAFAVYRVVKKNKLLYATEIVFDSFDGILASKDCFNRMLWSKIHKDQVEACKNAAGVSCVTREYLQKRYFPVGENKFVSNYSSIELTEDFFLSPKKYPVDNDCIKLVHVSKTVQFNGRKGHNDLIQVLSVLKAKGIKAHITFIGEDYDNGISRLNDFAKQLDVAESITFTGFLSYSDMRNILSNSDIAVLPTKAEGLPRVVIEAMAMGLPCLTTDVSGNSELIEKRFLFEYGDVDSMVRMLELLITNQKLYEEVSERNFLNSKEYSKEVLDARRMEFYKSLREVALNH